MKSTKYSNLMKTACMIVVIVVTFGLVASLFSGFAAAGDQNTNEHQNETNEEAQSGMENNDNGQCTLLQLRPQVRPTGTT